DLTGRPHVGLDFLLESAPEVLKRYRSWSDQINEPRGVYNPNGFGFIYIYGITGYAAGVRYLVHIEQNHGLTKEEDIDGLGAAFIYLGPRGMETVAEALEGYEWHVPDTRPPFPDNWRPDPEAFSSGIDFSDPRLTAEEYEKIIDWYERVLGEVPGYVQFWGE